MFQDGDFKGGYVDNLCATVLELKYANSNMALVIVLPDECSSLPELEANVKDCDLAKVFENLQRDRYQVFIPKFTVEYEIKLNDALKNVSEKN